VPVLLYLMVDVSGSTVRQGFLAGVTRALPAVVGDLAQDHDAESRFGVLTYATEAAVLIPMTRICDLDVLPAPAAGGLSSLVAGFDLLADVARQDRAVLMADGLPAPRPTVLVAADDLPTDRDEDVLAARDRVDADLHVALPGDVPALAVAGLRATRHRLALGAPEQVAASLCTAVRTALA
jgi:uncharacterized protein YegL